LILTTADSFDEAFSEAVDEAFSSLGDSAKQAVYWYVTTNHGLQKKDLASRIEDFAAALEAFFGSGSSVIEIMILEKLSSRTGAALTGEDYARFVETVKRFRKRRS
jgi:hypothetical protein